MTIKCRVEANGLHFFDRITGEHLLIDEVKPQPCEYSLAPRTISIAITDDCDFNCDCCYVKKNNHYLSIDQILNIGVEFDRLGTLDIALGGGEPTLHPDLVKICERLWNQTSLGISITTHGYHLTKELVKNLIGIVSIRRVSIDGIDPIYSKLRGIPIKIIEEKLSLLKGVIPFGVNTVVNSQTINGLDALLDFAIKKGAMELLLLPMIKDGEFELTEIEWTKLDKWIIDNFQKIPLRVLTSAKNKLSGPFLFNNTIWDNDYAFITANLELQNNSYEANGILINSFKTIDELLVNWRKTSYINKL